MIYYIAMFFGTLAVLAAIVFVLLPKRYTWYRLGISLGVSHSLIVLLYAIMQFESLGVAQGEMAWTGFLFLDFMIFPIFFQAMNLFKSIASLILGGAGDGGLSKLVAITSTFLILGGLSYGILGFLIGRLVHLRKQRQMAKAGS
jgi:hypothetical protein